MRKSNAKRDRVSDEPKPVAPSEAPISRWARLRKRLRRPTTTGEVARRQPTHEQPPRREWPRRVLRRSLELGTVVAVAWGLLVAGREVYDYATTSARFEVQHLIYAPTTHVDDDTLRELLAIEPGTNILACDLAELSERVAQHPWVALATVTRNLPDTLEVSVVEHQAQALVLAGRFYLVNGEGRPFKQVERGERGELPIITGIERGAFEAADGQPVSGLVDALALLELYQQKQRPRLGEIHLGDDHSVTLYTAESGTALHLGRDEFEARLERWDALRAALGERADALAVVHLDHDSKPDRRDRVVARFANERDNTLLLAAAAVDEQQDEQGSDNTNAKPPSEQQLPARRAGRRKRIPTYE